MSRESENWRRNFPNEVPQRTGLAPSLTLWLIGGAEYVALNRLLNFGVKRPRSHLGGNAVPGGAYTVEENDQDYSWRRTRIGSALDARYAGMSAAKKAASSNAPALKAIVAGSAEVVS